MALTDLLEYDDRWDLVRLSGRRLGRIEIGGCFRLHFLYEAAGDPPSGDKPWYVNIESRFALGTPSGSIELEGDPPSRLAPVLDLLGERLASATVWLDSRLEIRFENGAHIDVPCHSRYETWQVHGPDGLLIVSTPGGGEPALWPGGKDQVRYTIDPQA